MPEAVPHPANVPGDYFVEDGCCMTCAVPFVFASDLFAWAADSGTGTVHCYVKKQPETPDEADRMFEVIRHAEAGCIMYRGRDPATQRRLVEAGEGPICVDLPTDLLRRSAEVLAAQERQRHRSRRPLHRFLRWLRGRPG